MRVLQLEVQNFCNLLVVEITRDGRTTIVSGPNAAGKTSVINSFFWALRGSKEGVPEPIREGQDFADVKVWLGEKEVELVVHRRQTKSSMKLEVTDAAGKPITGNTPQALLDALLKKCSFDPTTFIQADTANRKDMLLDVCGVRQEVAALDLKRKRLYEDRTVVGREVNTLKAQVDAVPMEVRAAKPEAVKELEDSLAENIAENEGRQKKVGEADLELKKIGLDLSQLQNQYEWQRNQNEDAVNRIEELKKELDNAEVALEAGRKNLNDITVLIGQTEQGIEQQKALIASLPQPDPEALASARALISDAQRRAAQYEQYQEKKKNHRDKEQEYSNLTQQIEDINSQKRTLIQDKLGDTWKDVMLDETGQLHVDGRLFDSHSTAGQLKISAALAMAANPELRVMRITHGSELDQKSLDTLYKLAEQHDFDLWIETVSSSKPEHGIFIEEGQIK